MSKLRNTILILIFYSGVNYAVCDLVIGLNEIDISNLDKAKVLQALYKGAKPQGLGYLHYKLGPLKYDDAKRLLEKKRNYDYLSGRVLKIDLSGNTLNTRLYNRDNGENAAEKAICEFFHQSSHYPSVQMHMSLEGASG